MTTSRLLSLRSAASVLALAASAAAQSVLSQGQVVMAIGDPIAAVPGATCGGSSPIDSPVVDLSGNMLFRARMVGTGVVPTNDRGLFLGRTGSTLQMIVRSGDADPTGQLGAGTTLNTATGTGIGGNARLSPTGGLVLFGCSLSGPSIVTTGTAATGNNSTALIWGPPGGFLVLAQRAMPFTTASNNQTYQFDTAFNSPSYQQNSLNGTGQVTFQATVIGGDVVGTTNNVGWLHGLPGSLDWVARKGDNVVISGGASPGTYPIGSLGFNCMLNAAGQILHDERLSNTAGMPSPATTANDNCVFVYSPGFGNQLLVREGDQAPGAPAGALYGAPTISQGFGGTGQTAFGCQMTGAVTTADDTALFLGGVGNVQMVVREGDQAPGLPACVLMGTPNFNNCYSDYQGGSVVFYCTLTGTGVTPFNDTSLWLGRPGNLQMIAREGDAAPGFENVPNLVSATFGDSSATSTGSGGIVAGSAQMNDHGQIVFSQCKVTVVDSTPTTTVYSCTYCWDPVVGLKLFASPLDNYPTVAGPTNSFTAGGIQFPSGDSCPLDLNNNGDVVHAAFFNTGSAAVRTRLGSLGGCSPSAVSTATGGSHVMQLDAGVANAGNIYIIAGSVSGTRPGFTLFGQQVPLNIDYWFNLSLSAANTAVYANTFGTLDAQGRATASFNMPAGYPAFAGTLVNHAYGVIDNAGNITHVSLPGGVLLY
jgi:hypothetical protein